MKAGKGFLFPLILGLLSLIAQAQNSVAPANTPVQPFDSREEIEEFLSTAKIVKAKGVGKGITSPQKLTLDNGRLQLHAAFKTINERKAGLTQLTGSMEVDFKDCWMFEVAAYQLDKLLGLNMIPVTVERAYNGHKGALQLWIENAMTEADRQKQKLHPPSPLEWNHQMFKVRLFDNLIYNIDRNLGNLLITSDWKIYMIDHSRTFKSLNMLKSPKDLSYFSRSLMEALRKLDEGTVTAHCAKYLMAPEIRTMLKRRDLILQLYDQLVVDKGKSIAYP